MTRIITFGPAISLKELLYIQDRLCVLTPQGYECVVIKKGLANLHPLGGRAFTTLYCVRSIGLLDPTPENDYDASAVSPMRV
jgi:hypothetical protein